MLQASRAEYAEQQAVAALAVAQALKLSPRGPTFVAQSVQQYQAAAVALSLASMNALLAEQTIPTTSQGAVNAAALLTATQALSGAIAATTTDAALARLVTTLVRDAGRTARAVDTVTRPAVTGYVRVLVPPSCGRCAILAGRVYKLTDGFERHPGCDCMPTPTDIKNGVKLATDPKAMFDAGQITDLSQADAEAVRLGADLGQVVNIRRRSAGLTVGSSVFERGGIPTPEKLIRTNATREAKIAALKKYGYITT